MIQTMTIKSLLNLEAEISRPDILSWMSKQTQPHLPQSFQSLTPGQKLLYVYLAGRGKLVWPRRAYIERTGISGPRLSPALRALDKAGLASYTEGVGSTSKEELGYPTVDVGLVKHLGQPRELPEDLIKDTESARLIYLYLARTGLTLTTPQLQKKLGLSWVAYRTLKALNMKGYVQTTGERPLLHKAV